MNTPTKATKLKSNVKLKMYVSENDTVIAESNLDACKVYMETYGTPFPDHYEEWREMPDDHQFTLDDEDSDPRKVTLSAAEWIAKNGRGHLGSQEY
jgi:hypothetical protein